MLFADFRALLAGDINNNDQLKPLYARLKEKGWKGQDYITHSILSICQKYHQPYLGRNPVSLMRTIIKDLLETGVIRDPELVNRIHMLPCEGMLKKEDKRIIDRISVSYEKAVNNGTIGYDDGHMSLLNRITRFLDKVSINPKAHDLFLIYCHYHRSKSGSNAISVSHGLNQP